MPESSVYSGLRGSWPTATRSVDEPGCAASQRRVEPAGRPARANSGRGERRPGV